MSDDVSIIESAIRKETPTSCKQIKQACSIYFGVDNIMNNERFNDDTILIRHLAIYLCRRLTKISTTQIGKSFLRNHSTIVRADQKIQRMMICNPVITEHIRGIINKLVEFDRYKP